MTIFHLAHRGDWNAAQEAGSYRVSTRGATLDQVGFIHCSERHQLARVAQFVYRDDPAELCVLVLDDALARASGARIVYEDGGDGELFPHIYGPIDPRWVGGVLSADFDAAGEFRF